MTDAADARPRSTQLLAAAEPAEPRPLGGLIDAAQRPRAALAARARRPADRRAPRWRDVEVRGVTDDSRAVRDGSAVRRRPRRPRRRPRLRRVGRGGRAPRRRIVEQPLPDVDAAAARGRAPRGPRSPRPRRWWYGDPSRQLGVVGITGTDGKTTTSFLAVAALEAAGLSTRPDRHRRDQGRRPRDAHAGARDHARRAGAPARRSRAMADAGNAVAVVETTSHGLALDRVRGIAYDVAILTNLTHEHLEFHGTWEAYRDAKLSLFERLARPAPTNPAQDSSPAAPWPKVGDRQPRRPRGAVRSRPSPTRPAPASSPTAPTRPPTSGRPASRRTRGGCASRTPRRRAPARLELRLAGRFNVHNALAVVALGEALGLDPAAVRAGLASVEGVPGRMERIDAGQPFGVIVDYAHRPASLAEGPRPPRAARGGARRRADRGVRVGRGAGHGEARR